MAPRSRWALGRVAPKSPAKDLVRSRSCGTTAPVLGALEGVLPHHGGVRRGLRGGELKVSDSRGSVPSSLPLGMRDPPGKVSKTLQAMLLPSPKTHRRTYARPSRERTPPPPAADVPPARATLPSIHTSCSGSEVRTPPSIAAMPSSTPALPFPVPAAAAPPRSASPLPAPTGSPVPESTVASADVPSGSAQSPPRFPSDALAIVALPATSITRSPNPSPCCPEDFGTNLPSSQNRDTAFLSPPPADSLAHSS